MVLHLDSLFSGLIGSKTRVKLLMRLYFNPQSRSYLRELSKEFGVSSNAVGEELNQLARTNLLKSDGFATSLGRISRRESISSG